MNGERLSCQSCGGTNLWSVVSLGNLPPCNDLRPIDEAPREQVSYPTELFHCRDCDLAQLGFLPPAELIFGADYPYTSSTTKILRDNFAELYSELTDLFPLAPSDLIVDIGGNDGNLLSNFTQHRTLNVTPENIGKLSVGKGIAHLQGYWGDPAITKLLLAERGQAAVITATNVFAHTPDPNAFLDEVTKVLRDDGVFVCEAHYLGAMLQGVQFDAIYGEHARVYSLSSLRTLLGRHGLRVVHAKKIPTHGGSIRVYARREQFSTEASGMLADDHESQLLRTFSAKVAAAKRALLSRLCAIRGYNHTVAGIGAPSRAGTLISYTGIDSDLVSYICEAPGSYKLGKFAPGTRIPIVDEERLYREQPDYALLFSWHISSELIPKLRAKGYRGKFIIPLPLAVEEGALE